MDSGRSVIVVDHENMPTQKSVESPVDAHAVYEQLGRILSDPLFHNSKRFSTLLKFVVSETVEGKHSFLKERTIGIEVFGRTADYDTNLDASVRVAVGEVRKRLGEYYRDPKRAHELRIELPTRSYVPEFKLAELTPQEQQSARRGLTLRKLYLGIPIAAAIVVLALWGFGRLLTPRPAIDRFWAPILNSSAPVLISIGSPPSDNSSAATPKAPVEVTPGMTLRQFIDHQINVPESDISAAVSLASFLGQRRKESYFRFARTTPLSDLRQSPLILLGSLRNDWTVRLGADLHFQFKDSNDLNWIEDESNPASRNWNVDLSAPYDQVTREYALVTRAFDQTTGQWWIGVAGLTGLGTAAAQQMLLDPNAMTVLSDRLPPNWDRKNLQVVLAIKMVKGSVGTSQVVGTYSW